MKNNKNWSTKNQFAGYLATKQDQTPTNLDNNLFYEKKYNQFLNLYFVLVKWIKKLLKEKQ